MPLSQRLLRPRWRPATRPAARRSLGEGHPSPLPTKCDLSDLAEFLRLAEGLERLAAGQLTVRLTDAFPAGYQKLRDDFNIAMDQLQAAMGEIQAIAFGIRSGGDEIARSAQDLSSRTEQQASARVAAGIHTGVGTYAGAGKST